MTWEETKRPVVTKKGVEQKAPIHRQVKLTQGTISHPIPAPRPKEIQEFLDNPTPFLTKFSQLYPFIKDTPKWQSREDYIRIIIKQTTEHNIKDRDIRNFLDYIKEAEEDSKEKPKPSSVYEDIITKLHEAKTLKEVGKINQFATKTETQGKITFDQLQKIYSLIHEKDDQLFRTSDMLFDTYKMKIDRLTEKETIWVIVKEIHNSSLSDAYKTQLETYTKKKFGELAFKSEDLTLVNEFKLKIANTTDIDQLKDIGIDITDNVASGNFAKVSPNDVNTLHELVDDKVSQLYKEKIGTIEEFSRKVPMNLIVISNEVNRLKELNKKIQASSLNHSKKDSLDILINSKIGGIRELTPKVPVKSLDDIGKVDYEALKSKTDMILLSIADFTTAAQIDAFGGQLKKLTDAIGYTDDPKVIELIDNITKLYNEKRRRLYGDTPTKVIRTPEEYEISNLKYEAEHKPPEMLPPKEYEDVSKYTWGLTEPEAIKKYVDKQLKKNQSNIEYVNKQKAELEEIVKSKPHVLLTKAQIQKQYPKDAEQMIRDLWTYKTKKSDYEKNTDSVRFWQSKVDKINSGEWQKINTNYLREQYQKEVKEAIKKGKPVPYDVIKQYPEFVTSQDNRERYNRGKHTSFANVSIAVDTRHQENAGVKIKRQDGKAMDDKTADEIIKTLSQYQSVVGNITPIMKRENLTIAHTNEKHPFLSTAAGVFHPLDITVTMGYKGVAAHELTHFVDETAKRRHRDQPLYDYNLLALAKRNMNGGVERAVALSKSKSPEELEDARELRFILGSYWKRPEELFARLIEQYNAYKNKGQPTQDFIKAHYPYEKYIKTPAYWNDEIFTNMIPQIEVELKRKIQLAKN